MCYIFSVLSILEVARILHERMPEAASVEHHGLAWMMENLVRRIMVTTTRIQENGDEDDDDGRQRMTSRRAREVETTMIAG